MKIEQGKKQRRFSGNKKNRNVGRKLSAKRGSRRRRRTRRRSASVRNVKLVRRKLHPTATMELSGDAVER